MHTFDELSDESSHSEQSNWYSSDRRAWIANGVACSAIIALTDASLLYASVWLVGTFSRAYFGMPALVRVAKNLSDSRGSFYLDVALGWSLYPGPLVGSFFGVLAPVIWNLPISSFQGGLVGLVVGPLVAAVEGLILATFVLGVIWLFTGRRLWVKEN
jgi:hypothetical protein